MLLLTPIIIYVIVVLWGCYYWKKTREVELKDVEPSVFISVLIPIKNERKHLRLLLKCLLQQKYPKALVEFIFIDDHSTDSPEKIFPHIPSFFLLKNDGKGKKAALECGLKKASGELVVTIDADCMFHRNWLRAIAQVYVETKADMLICPVRIAPVKTFWGKMQAVEFQSLAASAAGAALAKHPIMCNGANLAFKRSLVEDKEDVFNQKYASGDDMFLMQYAKQQRAEIAYVKSPYAMASTLPVGWKQFWRQRFRWTSKSGGYRDWDVIFVGFIVALANLSLLVLPFFSLEIGLMAWLFKFCVDACLLSISSSFFRQQHLLWLTVLITPFYPLYMLVSVFGGLLVKR